MIDKEIVVIYHKRCPDGFGGAYAAWKKFGNHATYLPAGYGDPVPHGLEGKEVYLVDFCFELHGAMERFAKTAKRLVVLDHHQSTEQIVKSAPEFVFDNNRSGATIAWSYFHPDAPVPLLLAYMEDADINRNSMADTKAVYNYAGIQPEDFATWDAMARALDSDSERPAFLERASHFAEYFDRICGISVEAAKKVRFEDIECYFATTFPNITMRTAVGIALYKKMPPIALVVSAHPDGFGVSLRGDGTVDVARLAEKYGGGGHAGSAGFFLQNGAPIPWVEINE